MHTETMPLASRHTGVGISSPARLWWFVQPEAQRMRDGPGRGRIVIATRCITAGRSDPKYLCLDMECAILTHRWAALFTSTRQTWITAMHVGMLASHKWP